MLPFDPLGGMDDTIVAPVLQQNGPHRQQQGGHEKLQRRNSLPAVVFIYDKNDRRIHGAVVASGAYRLKTETRNLGWWQFSRPVLLAEPVQLKVGMAKFFSSVFLLNAPIEAELRLQASAPGGSLATHFPEFGRMPFKCLTLSTGDRVTVFQDGNAPEIYLQTSLSHITLAGVSCQVVDHLPMLTDWPLEELVSIVGDVAPAVA